MNTRALVELYKWIEENRVYQVEREEKIADLTESRVNRSVELQNLINKLTKMVEESDEVKELIESNEVHKRERVTELIELLKSIDCGDLNEMKEFGVQTIEFQEAIDQIIEIKNCDNP